MSDRKTLLFVGAIFLAFAPFAECMNFAFRGFGPYPWAYEIPNCVVTFGINAVLGYFFYRTWEAKTPAWLRIIGCLTLMGVVTWITVSLHWSVEHWLFGKSLRSSSFTEINGLVLGGMFYKVGNGSVSKLRAE